jgi:hypothetical protein
MILSVRRSSGFPILLEPIEMFTLEQLERQGLYEQLADYEKQLRQSEGLKDLKVEATKLEEILVFIQSLQHHGPIVLDFSRGLIILDDAGYTDVGS